MTSWEHWEEFHTALREAPDLGHTEEIDFEDKSIWVRITASDSDVEWFVAEYVPDGRIAFV